MGHQIFLVIVFLVAIKGEKNNKVCVLFVTKNLLLEGLVMIEEHSGNIKYYVYCTLYEI